jgi:hypothetical protein
MSSLKGDEDSSVNALRAEQVHFLARKIRNPERLPRIDNLRTFRV